VGWRRAAFFLHEAAEDSDKIAKQQRIDSRNFPS
jgi:hypothetical protein